MVSLSSPHFFMPFFRFVRPWVKGVEGMMLRRLQGCLLPSSCVHLKGFLLYWDRKGSLALVPERNARTGRNSSESNGSFPCLTANETCPDASSYTDMEASGQKKRSPSVTFVKHNRWESGAGDVTFLKSPRGNEAINRVMHLLEWRVWRFFIVVEESGFLLSLGMLTST